MSTQQTKENRQWLRKILITPEIAILYPQYDKEKETPVNDTFLVYIFNFSEGGVLLESPVRFEVGSLFDMMMRLSDKKVWTAIEGKVMWIKHGQKSANYYLLGIQFQRPELYKEIPVHEKRMSPSDVEFLVQTQLFDSVPKDAWCPLLNCITVKHLQAGKRLISQGDKGGAFYLIQYGSCVKSVEKEKKLHAVAKLESGDLVGVTAILTGEAQSAHVDTKTDMKVWSITIEQFDVLSKEYIDLVKFLTELITKRFSSSKVTADRNIGKYVINEILGRGGFSIVYKGIHSALNMPVAIKMLKHDLAMRSDFSQKFVNEAKIIARLNHDNIVKVYDIEELYRTFFIIMEYIDGLSIKQVLRNNSKLSVPKVLDILFQICAGLAHAHKQGIVHRDISPSNIFIQTNGRVKIVDFGLACALGKEDNLFEGTIFYTSPEQIQAELVDKRSDIYSLGIMAYEMITGQRPFPEDDIRKVIDFHLYQDIPDPRELVPDLPDELCDFLVQCTRKKPADRYQSTREITDELKLLAQKIGVETQLTQLREQRKMMSIFLFYQDKHQLVLNQLMEEFTDEMNKIGVELRGVDFKDI